MTIHYFSLKLLTVKWKHYLFSLLFKIFYALKIKPFSINYYPSPFYLPQSLNNVDLILDIGVASGTQWLYDNFMDYQFLLIDPLPLPEKFNEKYPNLSYKFVQCAVGSEDTESVFLFDSLKPSKSSFLRRNGIFNTGRKMQKAKVVVNTLDTIFDQYVSDGLSVGIKIDVEGYELQVIQGLSSSSTNVEWVICEASSSSRHHSSASLVELSKELASYGFYFSGVVHATLNSDGLVDVADYLFQKNN